MSGLDNQTTNSTADMAVPASELGARIHSQFRQGQGGESPYTESVDLVPMWLKTLDRYLEPISERLNPILVKESRQALKSRQFVVTFGLMLVAVLGWSVLGISLMVPGIYYLPGGASMLIGYVIILSFPVLIVVPFAAYRSLASEMEESTYDLLSISTLNSQQIVTGKLQTALLQIVVYYSAIAPCMAMTYLLRVVSLFTIVIALVGTFALSTLLVAAALLVSTISQNRVFQVFLSLILIVGLLSSTFYWCAAMSVAISQDAIRPSAEFWQGILAAFTFYLSFIVLGVWAAAGQLSFASENRSTRLRKVMLVQQILLLGWVTLLTLDVEESSLFVALLIVSAIYWAFMGTLMIGEKGVIAPRARRSLPASLLGRMALTWLNPGGGTGYLFAIITFGCLSVVAIVAHAVMPATVQSNSSDRFLIEYGIVLTCYLATYLGINRLILLLLGRWMPNKMAGALALQAILIVMGVIVPLVVVFYLNEFRNFDYDWTQIPNIFWTIAELIDGNGLPIPGLTLLVLCAVTVFLANFFTVAKDIFIVRIETPERVLADTGKSIRIEPGEIADPLAD